MLTDTMITRTCRYCGEDYPADEPDLWRTKNQCQECYNSKHKERENELREIRLAIHKAADPLILPARVKLTHAWSSCDFCEHCQECREHVQHGRPVMCAPVYASDLLIEKAYMARKEVRHE